jgi:hypothetical protein
VHQHVSKTGVIHHPWSRGFVSRSFRPLRPLACIQTVLTIFSSTLAAALPPTLLRTHRPQQSPRLLSSRASLASWRRWHPQPLG